MDSSLLKLLASHNSALIKLKPMLLSRKLIHSLDRPTPKYSPMPDLSLLSKDLSGSLNISKSIIKLLPKLHTKATLPSIGSGTNNISSASIPSFSEPRLPNELFHYIYLIFISFNKY